MKRDKEYYLNHSFIFKTKTQLRDFAEGIGNEYKLNWQFNHDFENDTYCLTFWKKL